MVADDAAEAPDVVATAPGVGARVGLEVRLLPPPPGTGAEVGAGAEGAEAVGPFVGATTGLTAVGTGVGTRVGCRVSTVLVTDATERSLTPSASLAAASKELPVKDE